MAEASGAQLLEIMIEIDRDQSLQRYSDRWRSGDDPVHDAVEAPDLEDVGRTYDRLVAFAATRDVSIPLPSGTSEEM